MSHRFKDLKVWQRAMKMARLVYASTRDFPSDERFGLTSQLRRAAVSIPSNIAEGAGRTTAGEFRHFLGIALGSTYELETQLLLSQELGLAALTDEYRELVNEVSQVRQMLTGLRDSVQ